MKVKALILIFFLTLATSMAGESSWSAASKASLFGLSAARRHSAPTDVCGQFRAFISVNGEDAVMALRQMGVSINASLDGFVIATIPTDAMTAVSSVSGVT